MKLKTFTSSARLYNISHERMKLKTFTSSAKLYNTSHERLKLKTFTSSAQDSTTPHMRGWNSRPSHHQHKTLQHLTWEDETQDLHIISTRLYNTSHERMKLKTFTSSAQDSTTPHMRGWNSRPSHHQHKTLQHLTWEDVTQDLHIISTRLYNASHERMKLKTFTSSARLYNASHERMKLKTFTSSAHDSITSHMRGCNSRPSHHQHKTLPTSHMRGWNSRPSHHQQDSTTPHMRGWNSRPSHHQHKTLQHLTWEDETQDLHIITRLYNTSHERMKLKTFTSSAQDSTTPHMRGCNSRPSRHQHKTLPTSHMRGWNSRPSHHQQDSIISHMRGWNSRPSHHQQNSTTPHMRGWNSRPSHHQHKTLQHLTWEDETQDLHIISTRLYNTSHERMKLKTFTSSAQDSTTPHMRGWNSRPSHHQHKTLQHLTWEDETQDLHIISTRLYNTSHERM